MYAQLHILYKLMYDKMTMYLYNDDICRTINHSKHEQATPITCKIMYIQYTELHSIPSHILRFQRSQTREGAVSI